MLNNFSLSLRVTLCVSSPCSVLSLCPGRPTTQDYNFRLPCSLTLGWVQLTSTSHWKQMGRWEKNEARVLFPLCPVTEGWLCPCVENLSQQPSPIATDSSPCPFRPGCGNYSVSPSLLFALTLPTPLWTLPSLNSSQSPDLSGWSDWCTYIISS